MINNLKKQEKKTKNLQKAARHFRKKRTIQLFFHKTYLHPKLNLLRPTNKKNETTQENIRILPA